MLYLFILNLDLCPNTHVECMSKLVPTIAVRLVQISSLSYIHVIVTVHLCNVRKKNKLQVNLLTINFVPLFNIN